MRLIDADALLNKTVKLEAEAREQVVKNEPLDNPTKWHILNGVLAERTAFKYDLLDAPTVDAEPVKHGRWINHFDDIWPEESTMECSLCHKEQGMGMLDTNFCPNCGAKMDEDEWQEPEINPCRGCDDYDGRGGCKSNGGCGSEV